VRRRDPAAAGRARSGLDMPRRTLALALPLLLAAACRGAPVAPGDDAALLEADNPLRPLPAPPLGIELDLARLGVTPEKVRLGRWLFHDVRLSGDGTVSCATCHRVASAFSEPAPVSTGIRGQKGTRKSPTIVNLAGATALFWDGRARSLAEQAKGPIENPVEMGSTHEQATRTIAAIAGYRRHFREAFGDDRVDIDRIAEAIAAYEATRMSGNSAWDRFQAGDGSALSELAREGRDLFFGQGRCDVCHQGPNLTDGKFHNLGVGFRFTVAGDPASSFQDLGRHLVTGDPRDVGAFKTPSLRDVSKRAPYLHDGSMVTLDEVVVFYVRGGNLNPWLAPELEDVRIGPWHVPPLVAFLEALDGEGYDDVPPRSFPR
jgi:cytochrome c peroxidase